MSNNAEGLFRLYEEEMAMCRIAEEQLSTLTNFVIVITAAAVAFVAQKGLIASALPVTVGLIVLGAYGALMAAKMYERIFYHLDRAKVFRAQIYILMPEMDLQSRVDQVRLVHRRKFVRIHKVRLGRLWTGLHLFVCVLGLALTIGILA